MNLPELNCEVGNNKTKTTINNSVQIGANSKLDLRDIYLFSREPLHVILNPEAAAVIEKSYYFLKSQTDDRIPVYGVNTNFGDQVRFIDPFLHSTDASLYYQSIIKRQIDIVKSLSCSAGEITPVHYVRTAMLLRAHCLSQGYSAVQPSLIDGLIKAINAGVTPVVRRYGSIGASGDLIPLATIAAGITGEDVDVHFEGTIMKAHEAIQKAKLTKISFDLRDGLAMINGTSFMTAIAGLTLYSLNRLFKQMLFAIGMCLESMLVISSAYQPLVHALKKQRGEILINDFLLNYWQGSELLSHLENIQHLSAQDLQEKEKQNVKPLQDFYSLRAVPQGFGTFQENLERANIWIENEMNAVNDNPIFDADAKKIFHNANFMGYYVTTACDILKIDIAQASTWIHALLANLVHTRKSHGLPANLARDSSKNGVRALQLLAAALAVQNRKLALSHPSYTLPTEGDNQDVNSIGTHAAFDFVESVENLERLTAVLFLASAQALEFRGVHKAGKKSQRIYEIIRARIPTLNECRPMADEIAVMVEVLKNGEI